MIACLIQRIPLFVVWILVLLRSVHVEGLVGVGLDNKSLIRILLLRANKRPHLPPRFRFQKPSFQQTHNSGASIDDEVQQELHELTDDNFVSSDDDNATEEEYSFWEDPITVTSFNSDLQNLVDEDVRKAQDALDIMEEMYRQNNQGGGNESHHPNYILPNAASYTTVIQGWVQSDFPCSADKAQALLDRMERLAQEFNDESLLPNEVTYMLVCQEWADHRHQPYSDYHHQHDMSSTSARRAEAILYRMRERGMASGRVWTMVIDAWTKRAAKVPHAMDEAERLLQQMECGNATMSTPNDIAFRYRDPIKPSVVTYTSVITGLARSRQRNLAVRAEKIFERMMENGIDADMVAFTALLNCWARCTTKNERKLAAKRALSILDEMERRYANDEYHVKPSPITYSTAISAVGNSLDPKATELAEQILRRCYSLHESGAIVNVKPNTSTFNAVMAVFSRMKGPDAFKHARRTEHLLVEMIRRYRDDGEADVEPNVRTWGTVVLAWANSGQPDAAENAQRVVDKLEDMYTKGQTSVRPNVVCLTTLIGAWCRSGRSNGLERAEAILQRMEREFEECGDVNMRPNAITYITMMDGLMRRDEQRGAMRAQETVNRMLRLYSKGKGHARPNRLVFNCLINIWSRSTGRDAALKAEKIFQWMEAQASKHDDTSLRPDEVSFTGILHGWANQADRGGAERAQQIFDHMMSLSPDERGFQPSVVCHNVVIKAWGRSRSPIAIQRALRILSQLEQERRINPKGSLRPDVTTYSSVINCCAYYAGPAEGQQEALAVAMRTFQKLCDESEESPNNVTYGTLFKAIARLMPLTDERDKLVQSLFERCCQEGQVDSFVLKQMRNACTDRLYRTLVKNNGSKFESGGFNHAIFQNIPKEWSENVVFE